MGHGDRFSGNDVAESAQEWLDYDFTPSEAGEWCEIGVWNPATASDFRDAGVGPDAVVAAADRLTSELDDPTEEYTAGSPIYAACNYDISSSVIIDAV